MELKSLISLNGCIERDNFRERWGRAGWLDSFVQVIIVVDSVISGYCSFNGICLTTR